MPDKFTQLLPALGALVAFLVAAVLVLYIFRLLFGRRIRSPGGRNRARRLDIVDVFDLDRERQLVIVRRDNTEHLLLIGGPNDVLVEQAISRPEAMMGRPQEQRAPAPAAANWPAGPSAPPRELEAPPPKPVAAAAVNLPPDLFAPAPAKPAAPPPPAPPPAPPPGPRISSPAAPPPRPAPPRSPTPPFLARAQQRLSPRPKEPAPPEAAAPPPPPLPAAPPARPVEPPPASKPAAPPPPAPPPAAARPAAPPPAPPPRPAAPPPPPPPPAAAPADVDPLDSLEAEMARLLGRPGEKE
ncbi:MAG TPA: hypothetical protein VIG36_10670 [Methylocystis sp.]